MLTQGALRNAIATFIHVSPVLKDSIWTFLEQYDLPVVVGPEAQGSPSMGTQVVLSVLWISHVFSYKLFPSKLSRINTEILSC
jgi:nuclear pore complex protein Nup205